MVAAIWLWLGAVVAGAAGTVLILLNLQQLHGELLAQVVQQFPTEAAATQQRVANLASAILVGSGGLVVLLQLAGAVALRARRRLARLILVALWLLGAVQNVFMVGVVPGPILIVLVTATGLATVASVAMFLPPSNAWLAGRETRS
jgi:hypothetical protein